MLAYKRKVFRCDCGWAFHSLDITQDECGLSVSVVNAPRDYSLRERLKILWAIIKGDEHTMSEIVVDRSEVGDFIDFVSGLAYPVYCPSCGDDRAGKGSLINGDGTFCTERCFDHWQSRNLQEG